MNPERCWLAVRNRDATQDGRFFYGVLTTGVYCRPSCPSRLPLRKNTRFYSTSEAAAAAGLRPCKRCRPDATGDGPAARRIKAVCAWIEAHPDDTHSLKVLAARAHLSPFHFQRTFKALTGVSPKQYADAARVRRLKAELRGGATLSGAIYGAGFGSASRVYERADAQLGMTPRQYRRGGEGVPIAYASAKTPLGLLMIGATDRGLCFVQFGDSETALRDQLAREYPRASLEARDVSRDTQFAAWMRALIAYLEDGRPREALPVDVQGTAFQLKVWNYLRRIPAGTVQSYTEVAAGIGRPAAVRAVASACARNRVALVIPCHRVIRGDGGLGGFRWGLARKRTLIDRERGARTTTKAT
jgi:AraC family transcriptional regulator of adaptative response/methylated-DNA-[protein]-cysteine methyltransferase